MAALLVTLWSLAGVLPPAGAQGTDPGGRLLLVLAEAFGWEDLGDPPGSALGDWGTRAAVGVVTVAPGDPADPWTRLLSLGVGRRTPFPRTPLPPAALPEAELPGGEEARAVWTGFTGRAVPDRAGLLLFLPPTLLPQGSTLGDHLRSAGVSTVLIGGGGTSEEAPAAGALLTGSDGLVLGAVVPEPVEADAAWPGGLRTDWKRLDQLVRGAADPRLLVIQWSDLGRLQVWESLVPPERYRALREEALAGLLGWLEAAASRVASAGGKVMLLATAPPRSLPSRSPAPLILYPHDPPALVTSGSTRRPGVLDPGDLAPSILALLEAGTSWPGEGRALVTQADPHPYGTLDRFYRTAVGVSQLRRPVLHTYIIIVGSLVLAASLLLALAPDVPPPHPARRVLDFGLLVAAAAPLAMLAPPLVTTDGRVHLALVILLSLLIAGLLGAGVPAAWRFPVLAGATFLALLADTVAGAPLQQHAFLGNDPLGGARYYGVGNEYMGILLGSGLVVAGAFWEWRPTVLARLAGLAVLAGLVVVLGSPRWGANVGGTIASLFGAAYLLLRLGRRPPRWSHLLLLATGTLAAVGLVGLVEALLVEAGSRSHLGQLVARILQEGWRPLGEVALRKAATNLKLVQYTIWSRVLIATLIAFVILLYRPVGLFRQLTAQKPYLGRGIEAALVGALVALVANDSGVLAAATAMIPTMTTLLMALRSVRTSAGA